jgi:DNA-binding IclR family transcriptional regulator
MWKHGFYSAEEIDLRREARKLMRELREAMGKTT